MNDVSMPEALVQAAQALSAQLTALRRQLHRHPELSYGEAATSALVRERLDALGVPWQVVGEHGVVATIAGQHADKMVLLRADMDALPIQEENTHLPYCSTIDGAMHACGHDGHVAMLLGAAELLVAQRTALQGTVQLCFQQAEERGGGTAEMVQHLRGMPLVGALAVHLWSELEVGRICTRAGARMAACDNFDVVLQGQGTHGAYPHRGVDALRAATVLVQEASMIPSREVDPTHPALLSFGKLQAGHAGNVLPQQAHLAGTIRSVEEGDAQLMKAALQRVVDGVAQAHRVQARLDIRRGGNALVNEAASSALATLCVQDLYGASAVTLYPPLMVSENFGDFLALCPGLMALVGAGNAATGASYPHHHPRFNIDEAALPQGAALMALFALRALERLPVPQP